MMSLGSYIVISLILFVAGIVVILARKNIIAMLLGIELILNSAALNFVAYTRYVNQNLDGHIMAPVHFGYSGSRGCCRISYCHKIFSNKGKCAHR